MSDSQKSNLANLKPWTFRVIRREIEKQLKRKHWTRARWQKYVDERAAQRQQGARPHLKALRVQRQKREQAYQIRRQRMLAYHAKRRAAKAAAAE